jgi:hypothetical protein
MATTTNYGWTTPDDTALVKDGASAIRTLGSSVDTTTKNLNPETTLGDIAYRSSTANVKTRLGLGTAGQVLQVNSGANAPEWATPSSGGMTLINSGGTTLSGASITIGSIPTTYNNLQLIIRDLLPASANSNLYFRLNGDSNANRYTARDMGLNSGILAFDQNYLNLSETFSNSVTENLVIVDFPDYANTITWKLAEGRSVVVNNADNTAPRLDRLTFLYNQTAAITSITIFMNTGNLTSGTAYLYGVK